MISFIILTLIAVILIVVSVLIISVIGAGALLIFGDIFVLIAIIAWIIYRLYFKK